MDASSNTESGIRDEIEFARALTAVLLAVKLDQSEDKAQVAYDQIVNMGSALSSN